MPRTTVRIPAIVLIALVWAAAPFSPAVAEPERWRMEGWADTDFTQHSVAFSEIKSGGPPKDGIPSIDDPQFVPVSSVDNLGDQEPVISLELDGVARAYPLRILMWHEIVNDEIGGVPVAVTYCPLCNSSIVFHRTVDGRVLDFGTTGKLRNSDLVMYDRQTESWWQQFLGQAIVGELTGIRLKTIPSRVEAFALFAERHPTGQVLVPNNPSARRYGANPYANYDSQSKPYMQLFTGELPDYIEPMARVVSFEGPDGPHAVALDLLREKGEVTVGDIVITWQAGQNSALDARAITSGRDVGNIVAQKRSDDGMTDIVHDVTFAFVFHAFYPERRIQQES